MKKEQSSVNRFPAVSWLGPLFGAMLLLAGSYAARSQEESVAQEQALPELVIYGPDTMPLFRKGRGVKFTATVINHSNAPIVFVPPHKEWPEVTTLMWQAVDAKGRKVYPIEKYFIWCDAHGVMRSEPIPSTPPLNTPPREISDADLLVLQPGEKYEIPGLADPSFALNFLKRGGYRISLSFEFDPSRYKLSKNSKNADALKSAKSLYFVSNTLALTLN